MFSMDELTRDYFSDLCDFVGGDMVSFGTYVITLSNFE